MREGPRILVVDDEPAIRALVAKIIERAGFAVDLAANGAEAIEKLAQRSYAVLIVDLMMPQVDGYAVVEHLARRGGQRPAVIVITACDSAAIRRLDGSLVHSVVRKPFDIEVLSGLITAAAKMNEEQTHSRLHGADDASGDVVPFRG
jgi:DNA-binding response OmpR family regulator